LLTPTISAEALVHAQPQILFGVADTPEQQKIMRDQWRRLPLAATHQAFIPPDLISRASPRILEGAERVCAETHKIR
jgi:iron complex transport system substrate-binding protein